MKQENNSIMIDIDEIIHNYLPVSKKKARKFISLYLSPKRIWNRFFVEREKLEALLRESEQDDFPLNM